MTMKIKVSPNILTADKGDFMQIGIQKCLQCE